MKNNTFKEIWEELRKYKRIAMSLHYGPDGDSFGSCTAMKYFLERDLNAKVTLVSHDDLSENLKKISFAKEVDFGKDISELDSKDFDLFLFLDSGTYKWFSGKQREKYELPKGVKVINIDHHPTNIYFGDLNYVDIKSPSACSLLVDFFRDNNVKFDKELSDRLLLGVCTDSGFFTYDTNPEKALEDASFLIKCGADYQNSILKPVLYEQPLKLKRYFALLFNNLKIKGKVGYSSVSHEEIKKLNLNEAEVRLGPNELQFVNEFDVIFTLAELNDSIKGSFRSKKGIDVSLFAKALGGGGHKAAASFILPKMSLEDAENKVLKTIEEVGFHKQ